MKSFWPVLAFAIFSASAWADSLPVILMQPLNVSDSGTFSVVSTNATAFQWRWNGTDIPGATNATLSRSGSDPTGYYMAVVKNAVGWVPSRLAYLSRGSGGVVPFSNYGNAGSFAQACYQQPLYGMGSPPVTNGIAQVVAGPELDQMQPVGNTWDFWFWYNDDPSLAGYFDMPDQVAHTVSPGQTVYYRVDLTYPTWFGTYTQPSTTLKLLAGGGSYPTPSATNLKFPIWPEWPEPIYDNYPSPTNQVRIPGETFNLINTYSAYTDFGTPTCQWRKDGKIIPGATNGVEQVQSFIYQTVFTITNVQATDAGIYDVEVFGNQWIIAPTITLSVQITNGPGLLLSPRLSDTNFVCDLLGVASRNYLIQWSPDLLTWNNLLGVSNATGTVTFTNSLFPDAVQFYRARLLPE
jgi:hypothetical protein